jgi:small subunit ribosomal protein S20
LHFSLFFDKIDLFTKSEVKKMPNIKSAKKRMRSNAKKTEINTLVTSSMRTAIKKFEKEVKAGNKEEASNNLNIAVQRIDKAMSSGLVHKNKAARLKSRLSKMMNTME